MDAAPSRKVAIYPGSFDPITNGHLDLIARGSRMVDRLIVGVLRNQRQAAAVQRGGADGDAGGSGQAVSECGNCGVRRTAGGLREPRAARTMILRGIRAVSDYELEWQMALMNRRLSPRDRNGIFDGRRRVFLHQLASGEGSGRAGRERERTGAAAGGSSG